MYNDGLLGCFWRFWVSILKTFGVQALMSHKELLRTSYTSALTPNSSSHTFATPGSSNLIEHRECRLVIFCRHAQT